MRLIEWMIGVIRSLADGIIGTVADMLALVEHWVRGQLAPLGMTDRMQTAAMVFVFAVLLLLGLRMFTGLVRGLLATFLVLMMLELLLPVLRY